MTVSELMDKLEEMQKVGEIDPSFEVRRQTTFDYLSAAITDLKVAGEVVILK
jgi:hypothetical protein